MTISTWRIPIYKRIIKSSTILLSLLVSSYSAADTTCKEPRIPLVPDGKVASKDEILAASKSLKAFQSDLLIYRRCLTTKTTEITNDDEAASDLKQLYLEQYNKSVDLETLAANEFNIALRAFKKK